MSKTLTTRTLADLYLEQGYGEVARDAYASLCLYDPEDEGLLCSLGAAQRLVHASKKKRVAVLLDEWTALVCGDGQ